MKTLSSLVGICALFSACTKERETPGSTVAIYRVEECHFVPGKCQVDARKSTLQDTPAIGNQEILEYSQKHHQFRLTDLAAQKVKAFQDNAAFAVTVDKEVVYYFIYKPAT